MTQDPRERFSDRAGDYLRYRPRYPEGLIGVIHEETGLAPHWIVVDVGSGTGFSAEPFLNHGNVVIAVEPNAEMRAAAVELLGSRKRFRSVSGSAESTGLDEESVDMVVAGQAYHWFDPHRARAEFMRILRSPKWVVLFWNTRLVSGGVFEDGYESLLERFGTDYGSVRHDRTDGRDLEVFFGGSFTRRVVPNEQILTYADLEGRLRSSSYTPPPGDARHQPMLEALRSLFDAVQVGGSVRIPYDTEIFAGRLSEGRSGKGG